MSYFLHNPNKGLYGPRGSGSPYGTLEQPIVPQRLAVTNAYVATEMPKKRKRGRRNTGAAPPAYGGDPKHALNINDRDILIQDKRRHKRPTSTTTLQTTHRVSAGLNGLGNRDEPKWKTRNRFEYVGFAKTPADKNLLGENDRTMVPVLNGGLIDVKNRSPEIIPAHTLLKIDFPANDMEAMKIKAKVGDETGEDQHKIPLFLSPYNPKDHEETVKFLVEAVIQKNSNEAKKVRDKKHTRSLPYYEANRFADYLQVISAVMSIANKISGNSSSDVYSKLKEELSNPTAGKGKEAEPILREAFKAFAGKGISDEYRYRVEAVTRLFAEKKKGVGLPFSEAKPDLSSESTSQLVRYFQTKDNALEGLLASIKSLSSIETGDIVAMSLTDAAPGKPLRILILD